MAVRLVVPADRPRLLAVALNNKVAAQMPHPITWTDSLIGRYCYFDSNTKCAVVTNASNIIVAWIAGAVWHESDENDNGDGVTVNHHKYFSINRFAIDNSVTNAQISTNIAALMKQLLNALNAFSVTDVTFPLIAGAIQTQMATALANAGVNLPDNRGKRFTGTVADWITRFP